MGKKCGKLYPQDEKKMTIKIFGVLIVIHSFFGIGVCIYSTYSLQSVNITWFLPIDVITLLIAIAFLNLIILVVGLSSAISNASFAWSFFHAFMVILIFAEIMISYYTSNVKNVMNIARKAWINSEDDEKADIQNYLGCCGFSDYRDHASIPCPTKINSNEILNVTIGCKEQLYTLTTSICYMMIGFVFVSILFTVFLDFVGCSICLEPDLILYDEKTDSIINYSDRSDVIIPPICDPLFDKTNSYTESSI